MKYICIIVYIICMKACVDTALLIYSLYLFIYLSPPSRGWSKLKYVKKGGYPLPPQLGFFLARNSLFFPLQLAS